jgi:hypothetical protein
LSPVTVREELTDAKTPETVRRRVLALPAWFEVRTAQETQKTSFPVTLHRGEREAILLAGALHADVLLIDEQVGRTIALSRNLPLSGTLGVLERADRMGFVSDFQCTGVACIGRAAVPTKRTTSPSSNRRLSTVGMLAEESGVWPTAPLSLNSAENLY